MPTESKLEQAEMYSVRAVARMTGISPERMRAWESRHGAVQPLRTGGGTRRYSVADVERLRLLRQVTDAGHRIGEVARLDLSELASKIPVVAASEEAPFAAVLDQVYAMDGVSLRQLLDQELEARGAADFGQNFALPLAAEIGQRWKEGLLSVSAEHLATRVLRSLLSAALDDSSGSEASQAAADRALGPQVLFATPSGELHDLGLLVAALISKRAGARPVFLGADIPEAELVSTVRALSPDVLALGFVTRTSDEIVACLRAMRSEVPASIEIWIGGVGIQGCPPVAGVERVANFDQLDALTREANFGAAGAADLIMEDGT